MKRKHLLLLTLLLSHSTSVWGMKNEEDDFVVRTRIPNPSTIKYEPSTVSHLTPTQLKEQAIGTAKLAGFKAFMKHSAFGLESMGDNSAPTLTPGSIDASTVAFKSEQTQWMQKYGINQW